MKRVINCFLTSLRLSSSWAYSRGPRYKATAVDLKPRLTYLRLDILKIGPSLEHPR